MARGLSAMGVVLSVLLMICGRASAVIETGPGPLFVYQRDLSGNQDSNLILTEAGPNELQWFENGEAWLSQSGRAETCAIVLHFKAPAGYVIQSADIFTRSYLKDDLWESLALDGYWGTVQHANIWDYYYQDTRFYHRQNNSGIWTEEKTTSIPALGAADLFLTFTTYQSGYYSMTDVKKWFLSPAGGTADPGLRVTLKLVEVPPTISIDGSQLLIAGRPLQGIFVTWGPPAIDTQHNEAWFRSEFRRMKSLGIIGVGLDVGWNTCEPADGNFTFATLGINRVIGWAKAEGMWVHLLLTPHYTPGWVFTKYGDIKMKDAAGNSVDGSFLTFSPSSPAVADQIDFQQRAVAYFQQYYNVIGFWLTNEQGYGQSAWLDYSSWARTAWNTWLSGISPDPAFWQSRWSAAEPVDPATTPLPTSEAEGRKWQDWRLFRQQEFNRYLNRLYDGAVSGRSRFIPVGHKFVFYTAYDAFAGQWGLHFSPVQTKADVVACDAYGSNPMMEAGQRTLGKPILLAETNFTATPTGPDGQGMMARMLLDQFFQGAMAQTVYAWNAYDAGSFPWGLQNPDGSLLTAALGIGKAAAVMATDLQAVGTLPAPVALLLPTDRFNDRVDEYWMFQTPCNGLLGGLKECGLFSHIIYTDDVVPESYPGRSALGPAVSLDGYQVICGMSTAEAGDQGVLASDTIRNWVNDGGVLFLELWDAAPPAWTGITASSTSRTTYSHYLSTTYLQCPNQSRSSGISYRLSSSVGRQKIWARWDGTSYNAILAVPYGSGWVVAAGTPIFEQITDGSAVQPLLWDVLGLAGYSPPVSPTGPIYQVIGNLLYLRATTAWSGTARLPAGFAGVASITQYTNQAEVMAPTVTFDGARLTGLLGPDQFCTVTLSTTLRYPPGPGDANGDGRVDVSDLGILAANYGKNIGATWAQGDLNRDGKVDVSDLGVLAANYGQGTGGTTTSGDFQTDWNRMMGIDPEHASLSEKSEDTAYNINTICGSGGIPLLAGLFITALVLVRCRD